MLSSNSVIIWHKLFRVLIIYSFSYQDYFTEFLEGTRLINNSIFILFFYFHFFL